MIKVLCSLIVFSQVSFAADISFDSALDLMEQRSEDLKAQQVKQSAAQTSYLASNLSFLPTLSTGYNSQKTQKAGTEIDTAYVRSSIDLFKGGKWSLRQAAKSHLKYEKNSSEGLALSVQSQAMQVLVDFIRKQRALEIVQQITKMKESSVQVAKARFKRGLIARQEVDKIEIDFLNSKAIENDALIAFNSARATLRVWLGGDVSVETKWPWPQKLRKLNKQTLLVETLNLEQRPDFRSALSGLEREKYYLRAQKMALAPSVDFTLSWNQVDNQTTEYNERTALLSVNFPLWSGLSDYAAIKKQKATFVLAQANFINIQRQATSEWISLIQNLVESLNTLEQREATLKLARRVYKENFSRFQKGLISVNDLQVDHNRLLQTENLANAGEAAVHLAFTEYCHGKGVKVQQCLTQLVP